MRSIYLLLIWIIILLLFLLLPRNPNLERMNRDFYLKEYYTRFLINLKELENNKLKNLAQEIDYSGCYSTKTIQYIRSLRKIYDFYKKKSFDVVFGIEVYNTNQSDCYAYFNKTCICFFENFERAMKPEEKIEVKEASMVTIETNIVIGDIILKRLGIGYYST